MQTSFGRSSLLRPTAAGSTPVFPGERIRAQRQIVTKAFRAPSGRTRGHVTDNGPSSSRKSERAKPIPSKLRRGSSEAKAPRERAPRRTPEVKEKDDEDDDAGGEGSLENLDELLADANSVRQLRQSLLASLATQHQEAMKEEEGQEASSSGPQDHGSLKRPADSGAKAPKAERVDKAKAATAAIAAGAAAATGRDGRGSGAAGSRGADAPSPSYSSEAPDSASGVSVPLVILKKDKSRLFVNGNPMVYGGAVDCVIGRPPPGIGDTVLVADASRRPLGWGVFNPNSMFRVRLLQLQPEIDSNPAAAAVRLDVPGLVALRIKQAADLRRSLGLPSQHTNVYRLINSEGDRVSGLIADVLGDTVVVQALAGWVVRYRSEVEAAIRSATGLTCLVWRPLWNILAEEGLQPPEEAGAGAEDGEAPAGGAKAAAAVAEDVEVREAGLRLLANPLGQKTGFYADQRDSRAFLAGLVRAQAQAQAQTGQGEPGAEGSEGQGGSSGPSLLDLCCYSGGFALSAAAAGASRVVGVDSSEAAVALATANARLNGLSDVASFVRADVSDYMKTAVAEGQQYDIVVLDPPKLAPDRNSLGRAWAKYLRLNQLAMRLVRPGGLLMTCSCSGAMTQSGEFTDMVVEAALQVGRQPTLLRTSGAAPDHALHPAYPEGQYLTNVTLRLL